MRVTRLLAILAILLFGVASVNAQSVLRAGIDVDAGTMDPRLGRDTTALRMQELLFNGLVYLDAEVVPQPDLAESWEFLSPTELVFKLREGVTFHDGSALDAEDVVYTYNTILSDTFGAPRRSLYTPISEIVATGPYEVTFRLEKPFAPILQYLDMGIVPSDAAEAQGEAFGDNPVGTGPFKLASWSRGATINLAANDDYFKGRPNIDQVIISVIPDNNVRLIALESGDLDLIHSPIPPQDLARLKDSNTLEVRAINALGYTYLNVNLENSILSDVRVRKALAYLTDRETISEVLFYGMDTPGYSFLLPGTYYYTEDVNVYDYNVERATALLAEAGWADTNGDGILDKDGRPLRLELTTNVDPNRQQVLEFLQGEWSQVGIDASVRVYEWPSFIADVENGVYDIALIGWLNLADPDRSYLAFKTGGDSNYGSYSNARVDTLLDEGRTETNLAARKAIYTEVAQIITDELPYIFLVNQGYVVVNNPALEGFDVRPTGSWKSLESATLDN